MIDDGTRELNIETEHNYIFKVIVKVTDTIAEVKDKIFEKESIPVDQQRLYFNDLELEDLRAISEYGLKNQDTLQVKAGIFIQISDDLDVILFTFYARVNETILSIKERI